MCFIVVEVIAGFFSLFVGNAQLTEADVLDMFVFGHKDMDIVDEIPPVCRRSPWYRW